MLQRAFRWNKLTTKETKTLTHDKLFRNISKDLLLRIENEIAYFQNFKSTFDSFKKINLDTYLGPLRYTRKQNV